MREGISPRLQAILDEELRLLDQTRDAIARARAERDAPREGSELRSVDALRELRAEAATASEGDLPQLLHEISVRQRLRERHDDEAPLPDDASPYMAHLRVREGGAVRDYLLGRATFVDVAAGVRVIDWRAAPIARVFYRCREGDDYEEPLPGRVAEGVVEARRVLVIVRGVLVQVLGDDYALTRDDDGAWHEGAVAAMSSGGAGTAVRQGALGVGAGRSERSHDVTALLDATQYAAIRDEPARPMLVLGSAGSGKTTVALHRLSAQCASGDDGVRVVVPEEGLARLSRRLLAPLGVAGERVQTLDAWSASLASTVFGRLPARFDDAPASVVNLKRHPALHRALRERFRAVPPEAPATLRALWRWLADALTDRTFLQSVVDASGGTLGDASVTSTVARTLRQLDASPRKQAADITDRSRVVSIDGRAFWEDTPDARGGSLDVEDLPLLLFARAMVGALPAEPVRHAVVDEAEDVSLAELSVLSSLLGAPPRVTVAGDEGQQTLSCFDGWSATLDALGARDAAVVRLETSYRCPRPVAEFARAVLGPLGPRESPVKAAREGAPVGVFAFPQESHTGLFLAGALRELVCAEPHASVGVIAHDDDTARRFFALLGEVPASRLVLDGEFTFEPGVDVTTVECVKGLEFDYVVLPDVDAGAYPDTDDARRRLHVAATRASHQLWVASSGAPSPLLPRATE